MSKELKSIIEDPSYCVANFAISFSPNQRVISFLKKTSFPRSKLMKISNKAKKEKCLFFLNIPHYGDFKSEINNLVDLLKFFELNLKEQVNIRSKVIFQFPFNKFHTDPKIPIVLDEKWGKLGKLELSGIRVSFPDYKEFDSVILDIHKCEDCGEKAIMVQVFSEETKKLTCSLPVDLIKKSKEFTSNFIRSSQGGKSKKR